MIKKYAKGDALKILWQPEQYDEARQYAKKFDEIKAWTLFDDNENVLAVFGYRANKYHQAECFALIGKNCSSKLLLLVRFVNQIIDEELRKNNLSIAVMTVRKNFYQASRLAKLLHFNLTAELPHFFLNFDYQLFERRILCL